MAKKKEEMGKARKMAIEILAEVEDMLDRLDITIPSEDREGNESEARLYGNEYWQLEDAITEIIKEEYW